MRAREIIGKKVLGVVQVRIKTRRGPASALLRLRFHDGSFLDFDPVCDTQDENFVQATFHPGKRRRLPEG